MHDNGFFCINLVKEPVAENRLQPFAESEPNAIVEIVKDMMSAV